MTWWEVNVAVDIAHADTVMYNGEHNCNEIISKSGEYRFVWFVSNTCVQLIEQCIMWVVWCTKYIL